MVAKVFSNKHVAGGVHRHASRTIQFHIGRRFAITRVVGPVARHRRDRFIAVHLANDVVPGVHNEQMAKFIRRQSIRHTQAGISRRASIAAIVVNSIPRNRCNNAIAPHLANALIIGVRNIQIAKDIHRHSLRVIEARICRRHAFAKISPTTVLMVLAASTWRMRLFPVSAMNRFPAESTVIPSGLFRLVLVAASPSSGKSGPPPASVVMMPWVSTRRMVLFQKSAIYTFLAASTDTPHG